MGKHSVPAHTSVCWSVVHRPREVLAFERAFQSATNELIAAIASTHSAPLPCRPEVKFPEAAAANRIGDAEQNRSAWRGLFHCASFPNHWLRD